MVDIARLNARAGPRRSTRGETQPTTWSRIRPCSNRQQAWGPGRVAFWPDSGFSRTRITPVLARSSSVGSDIRRMLFEVRRATRSRDCDLVLVSRPDRLEPSHWRACANASARRPVPGHSRWLRWEQRRVAQSCCWSSLPIWEPARAFRRADVHHSDHDFDIITTTPSPTHSHVPMQSGGDPA